MPNAIKIPETMNYQDVIAASDLVVCKAGYTTVAESISGKVPIIITARDGFIDDETVCKGVEKLGIGKRISNNSFLNMDYLLDCQEFAQRAKLKYSSLPKRFSSLHNEEVAKLILSC
ncbi:MAG: glycosyltransferase [Candidatus Woesearchaeota archaeon]|nr:glycosyltransferase [Candidatus Woesearchaeota archaeon]